MIGRIKRRLNRLIRFLRFLFRERIEDRKGGVIHLAFFGSRKFGFQGINQ